MIGWMGLVRKGITAASGIIAVVATTYGGLAAIWIVMKAPEAFAIVVGASAIAASIYLRGPTKVYNMQMSHPETDEMLRAARYSIQKQSKTDA